MASSILRRRDTHHASCLWLRCVRARLQAAVCKPGAALAGPGSPGDWIGDFPAFRPVGSKCLLLSTSLPLPTPSLRELVTAAGWTEKPRGTETPVASPALSLVYVEPECFCMKTCVCACVST